MQTAGPATSTRRKPPMLSKHSHPLSPHFFLPLVTTHLPLRPPVTCAQFSPEDPRRPRSLCSFQTIDWSEDWSNELFLLKPGGARLAAALFVSVNTAGKIHRPPLKKKPPIPESHRGKQTLLPYSVLLWQAASPGSSVSHVSSQCHNTPVPSGVKLSAQLIEKERIGTKCFLYI